ncbi:unnamed protein product [marine sediment metagenome]|uniref:Uncharacterized protein n=1 Tax=marine sediment metagenome TaxID=412755 RepID=X1AA83_9ZZZZ
MSEEGKLKKEIKKFLGRWTFHIRDEGDYIETGDNDGFMINKLLKPVDEAKKDFPICNTCTFENCYWKNQRGTSYSLCPPRAEWFETVFGDSS